MQVNNIINQALSAPGPAASPVVGRAADKAPVDSDLSSFNDIVGEVAADVSAYDEASLQVNTPQGGIIPIPQIYGTAPSIPELPAGEQYLDLENLGAVDQSVLRQLFGAGQQNLLQGQGITNLGQQGQQIVASGQALPTSTLPLANEFVNSQAFDDAAFDAELAVLQQAATAKPEGKQVTAEQQVAAATALPTDGVDTTDVAKIQKIYDEYLAKQLGADSAEAAQQKKVTQDKLDQAGIQLNGQSGAATTAATNAAAVLSALSQNVGDDVASFDAKPIDVNEIATVGKFNDISTSKLEAHLKALENQQILRTPMDQVKIKITQGVELGQDKITVKLHPAELGKVDVEMDVDKDGKTHVRIVADRSETLEFLRRDSHDLTKSLREAGVDADAANMEFSLNNGGEGQSEFGSNSGGSNGGSDEELAAIPQTQAEINMAVSNGGLNIVV